MIRILLSSLLLVAVFADCPLIPYPRKSIIGTYYLIKDSLMLSSTMTPTFMARPRNISTPSIKNSKMGESMSPLELSDFNLIPVELSIFPSIMSHPLNSNHSNS